MRAILLVSALLAVSLAGCSDSSGFSPMLVRPADSGGAFDYLELDAQTMNETGVDSNPSRVPPSDLEGSGLKAVEAAILVHMESGQEFVSLAYVFEKAETAAQMTGAGCDDPGMGMFLKGRAVAIVDGEDLTGAAMADFMTMLERFGNRIGAANLCTSA